MTLQTPAELIKDAWKTTKQHWKLLVLVTVLFTLVSGALNWVIGGEYDTDLRRSVGLMGAVMGGTPSAVIWAVYQKICLQVAAAKGESVDLSGSFSLGQLLKVVVASFVVQFLVGLSLLPMMLLVVPELLLVDQPQTVASVIGVAFSLLVGGTVAGYIALGLSQVQLLIIDKDLSVFAAIGESFRITEGKKLIMLFLGLLTVLVVGVGALLLGVGLWLAIPVVGIAWVQFYRQLVAEGK
jgi:hypothetical protein